MVSVKPDTQLLDSARGLSSTLSSKGNALLDAATKSIWSLGSEELVQDIAARGLSYAFSNVAGSMIANLKIEDELKNLLNPGELNETNSNIYLYQALRQASLEEAIVLELLKKAEEENYHNLETISQIRSSYIVYFQTRLFANNMIASVIESNPERYSSQNKAALSSLNDQSELIAENLYNLYSSQPLIIPTSNELMAEAQKFDESVISLYNNSNEKVFSAYADLLYDILFNPEDHYGGYEGEYNVSQNNFAIQDVNQDGIAELLFQLLDTYTGTQQLRMWTYDLNSSSIIELRGFDSPNVDFFESGISKEYFTHPYGSGDLRDYTLYNYDIPSDNLVEIMLVYSISAQFDDFNEYNISDDTDQDGMIYKIKHFEGKTDSLTKYEYNEFVQSLIPESSKLDTTLYPLTYNNVLNLRNLYNH
jgi:hypothetical protein